jgi:hypothetical protein
MVKEKLIGIAGTICLAVIVAACSGVVRGDTSPISPDGVSLTNRPISDTARVVIKVENEPDVASVAADEDAPVAGAARRTAVEPESSQDVVTAQAQTTIDLPKPENDVAGVEFRWSQLLTRDAIFPIYEPEFSRAGNAPYDAEELVIGVEISGEAKAYAIGPLNGREMVNDTVGGVPVLVTW